MSGAAFNPSQVERFEFVGHQYHPGQKEVRLQYRLDQLTFEERFFFPDASATYDSETLQPALQLLHWLAGISYFKAALPTDIVFGEHQPGPAVAALLGQVYRQGLAEMVWRNQLELPAADLFEPSGSGNQAIPQLRTEGQVVVPLGGGKDSLVSCSLLHQAGMSFRTIAVGQSTLIQNMAAQLEQRGVSSGHVHIGRRLDPQLLDLNRCGAFNGHVPVTGILAGVMAVGAVLCGYDTIVMSNERSAEAANVHFPSGEGVNHQYSKSRAFESAYQHALSQEVLGGLRYFSLLRGCSEITIARHFARLHSWFDAFSSCNRNFHLDGSAVSGRWCGDCPKCRFVFLALAPELAPETLTTIFGSNLLQQAGQLEGYRALCGLTGHKPFECVGEVEESAALMKALARSDHWSQSLVVNALAPQVETAPALSAFYELQPVPNLPVAFQAVLEFL